LKLFVLWSLFILPWASLIFMKKVTVKRYMPVALCMTVIHSLAYQAAYYYNWWNESQSSLFGWDTVLPVPWVYGPYLVVVIWVFRFTYGRFVLYFTVNLLLDALFMYAVYPIIQGLGYVSGESTLPTWGTLAIMTGFSVAIYLYQMWQEDALKPYRDDTSYRELFGWTFRRRSKAR
jgi:hypothetical protein